MAALEAQIYVMQVAFSKGRDTRSKFCGFPIARIGVAYLSAQFVLEPLFMKWAQIVPVWLPIVLYTVLLGAVADVGHANMLALVQGAETILVERNRLCKLDKHSTH